MINVDISLLKDSVRIYSNMLKKLEQNNTDIIYNFNELKKYWHDENVIKLSTDAVYEIQRMLKLESDVKSQRDLYAYLESEYSKIGKKIKCNIESQDVFDNKLDNIINMINEIINKYNDLGDISFYHKSYVIENQRNDLNNLRDSFVEIRNSLTNLFNSIKSIENNVNNILENIEVQMFLFNNFEKEV